jgi:hypothetical protein
MWSSESARSRTLRRVGLGALVLCTAFLAVENTVLLTWVATSRPWAALTATAALFRVGFALTVPLWLVTAAVLAGWALSPRGERRGRVAGRAAAGGRHDR